MTYYVLWFDFFFFMEKKSIINNMILLEICFGKALVWAQQMEILADKLHFFFGPLILL